MPFSIQHLLEGRSKPVTVKSDDLVQKALDLMIEYDFSQLPVVDEAEKPLGMVTSDSILRTLNSFNVKLAALYVADAMTRADVFHPEDDLFDVLDRLQATYAVLIIDGEGKLIGIITNYDSSEYFRRRAEDMMLVEDIEGMLRDYIRAPFTNESDELDEEGLKAAIRKIFSSQSEWSQKFRGGLYHYLNLHGQTHGQVKPDTQLIDQVLAEKFTDQPRSKAFDDLTMQEFINLFLHPDRWSQYQRAFNIDREAIYTLLDNVRKTRNILAHFKGELTATQRDQLRFCANWLDRHQSKVAGVFRHSSRLIQVQDTITIQDDVQVSISEGDTEIDSFVDEVEPEETRYAALAVYLQHQTPKTDNLSLTFKQIEEIIGSELPLSAYRHRSWWANDQVSHVQSQQWLSADWKVASVNMTEQQVKFSRMRERGNAYINFFNLLVKDLKEKAEFTVNDLSPNGKHGHNIAHIPFDRQHHVGTLNFSFTRYNEFRVQLNLTRGDQAQNKRIFDGLLAHRVDIEEAFGGRLEWDRLDDNRRSRLVVAHPGSIVDDEEKLAELRHWAVETMIRFEQAISQPLTEVVDEVFREP